MGDYASIYYEAIDTLGAGVKHYNSYTILPYRSLALIEKYHTTILLLIRSASNGQIVVIPLNYYECNGAHHTEDVNLLCTTTNPASDFWNPSSTTFKPTTAATVTPTPPSLGIGWLCVVVKLGVVASLVVFSRSTPTRLFPRCAIVPSPHHPPPLFEPFPSSPIFSSPWTLDQPLASCDHGRRESYHSTRGGAARALSRRAHRQGVGECHYLGYQAYW